MRRITIIAILCLISARTALADDGLLPHVPDGFVVDVIAKEPFVRNPCAMAFDVRGRIFIGQGPQYRSPTPETPGDRVDILIDEDGDGATDRVHTFASGFNCIQGLAWRGGDLYVANAPDLTIVRDLDGDDIADEYVRLFTDLGNLEHGLHGLNFGPDGLLYMSKGNSKGYNRPDSYAPAAFRELWGLPLPQDALELKPQTYSPTEYQHAYHTPSDDWGQQGGILRCDPSGDGLEIVSRGFRNPWDIAFDDQFNWLGTDNDQTQGDKIFSPFYGAHFGWGHSWSYDWIGEDHLPTVPASTKLFEGSGTGVIHYHADQFPPEYRNVFFINDWLRREVYAFRPKWLGAQMGCQDDFPPVFARADSGRSMPSSSGMAFDPTDIEVGPDGALYVLSWGHSYGATIEDGEQKDVGRVYRIRYAEAPLLEWKGQHRKKPHSEWSHEQLFADLKSSVGAFRIAAQNEFLFRCNLESVIAATENAEETRGWEDLLDDSKTYQFLKERFSSSDQSLAAKTWTLWTLGRVCTHIAALDSSFLERVENPALALETRIQALRVAAFRLRARSDFVDTSTNENGQLETWPREYLRLVEEVLASEQPRLRHEMVQAIWQSRQQQLTPQLLTLASHELDRVTYYSCWQALRALGSVEERFSWLEDSRAGVRLAGVLGLCEDELLDVDHALKLRLDPDERVANVAESWLRNTGGAEPIVSMNPVPGDYGQPITVELVNTLGRGDLLYTMDGSTPVKTSTRYSGPIQIDRNTTLKVAIEESGIRQGPVVVGEYQVRYVEPYRHREIVTDIHAKSDLKYQMDWTGLQVSKRHYTDRDYRITRVPQELAGLPFMQTANHDDRTAGSEWLTFHLEEACDVYVGVDVRVNAPLQWMKTGEDDGFMDTGLELVTTDPTFRLYRKQFDAGKVVLGGNTNNPTTDSRRGNYTVIIGREILSPGPAAATAEEVAAAMPNASPERGRELFMHPKGAGCIKCHQMEGRGEKLAPDLSDVGSRIKEVSVLIESILEPSASITEGFAQQQIITLDGEVMLGAILEETGRALRLVDSEGNVSTILKDDIEERIATKLSPMPKGFGEEMSPQQVADIVSYLTTQTIVGDRSGFTFRDRTDHIDIHLGEQRIATYLKRHSGLTRPALIHVTTPSGIQVTRNFPPRVPEDSDPSFKANNGIDHQFMHPGIWISYGDLNGHDYWRLSAHVEFIEFVEPPIGDTDSGSFAVRNHYMSTDERSVVCDEVLRIRFVRTNDGILMFIEAEYSSDDADFYFGDQEESGLSIRVASPIRVQNGNGTILNDSGDENGAEVRGKFAKWFDYFGKIDGKNVGLMVMSDPSNPDTTWLHARDYGVIATNPFPMQPRERREPYVKTWVRQGETFRLGYAVLIHEHDEDEELDREAAYDRGLELLRRRE